MKGVKLVQVETYQHVQNALVVCLIQYQQQKHIAKYHAQIHH